MNQPKRSLISRSLFSGSIHELLHPPSEQIPFLDGLRSIAVLLVISAHLTGRFVDIHGPNHYSKLPFVANGWIGVDLFFVLSGFFIGGQLWKELRDRQSIDVSRFVIRRGFRIWPLYFFTFFCVLTFDLIVGHGAKEHQYGWSDLIFITNFHSRGLVMGSWSLCTEEQFYIVTPLILFFFAHRLRLVRDCRPWLWGLLLFVPILRTILWVHGTGHFFQHSTRMFTALYFPSITHCDGLIMGLIIANLWVTREEPNSRFASPFILVAVSCVLLVALHQFQKEIFDFTVLALFFGSLVWLGIKRRLTIFNSKVFYWISRLSFGMYLNHEYMCPWIARVLLSSLLIRVQFPALVNIFGVALVALISAAIALVTFCGVEYPFLQIRKKVLERKSGIPHSNYLSPTSR
jgi:peptidoglycan/LPS O-acetylase OafA/YrhL